MDSVHKLLLTGRMDMAFRWSKCNCWCWRNTDGEVTVACTATEGQLACLQYGLEGLRFGAKYGKFQNFS